MLAQAGVTSPNRGAVRPSIKSPSKGGYPSLLLAEDNGRSKESRAEMQDLAQFAASIGSSVGKVGTSSALDADEALADFRSAALASSQRRPSSAPGGRRQSRAPRFEVQPSSYSTSPKKKRVKDTTCLAQRARQLKYLVVIDPVLKKLKTNMRNAANCRGRLDYDWLFDHYDHDHSGELAVEEFRHMIRVLGKIRYTILSDEMIDDVFASIDVTDKGYMTEDDLIGWIESGPTTLWDDKHLNSYDPIACSRSRNAISVKDPLERPMKPLTSSDVIKKMGKEIETLKAQLTAKQSPGSSPESPVSPSDEADMSCLSAPVSPKVQAAIPGTESLHYGISVCRMHGCSLGLHLDASLVVDRVPWVGQVANWNVRRPERIVTPGDRIIEVNGKRGVRSIIRELKKQAKMEIFFARDIVPGVLTESETSKTGSPSPFLERNRLVLEGDSPPQGYSPAGRSQATVEKANPEDFTYSKIHVEVNRHAGENLGIELKNNTFPFEVTGVSWQGLIAGWNMKAERPVQVILPGDKIIEANFASSADGIMQECKRKAMLKLVFLRTTHKEAPRRPRSVYVFEDMSSGRPMWAQISATSGHTHAPWADLIGRSCFTREIATTQA